MVCGNVVDVCETGPGDAVEPQQQRFVPSGARIGVQCVPDDLIRADPAAVGPGHQDLAPLRIVLLQKRPLPFLILRVNQRVAAPNDRLQHLVVPVVSAFVQMPCRCQGKNQVLVSTDPRLRTELSVFFLGRQDFRYSRIQRRQQLRFRTPCSCHPMPPSNWAAGRCDEPRPDAAIIVYLHAGARRNRSQSTGA